MISLNGNSILLVEVDLAYGYQLKEVLQKKGASVSLSQTISGAKQLLDRQDYDLVISCHKIEDGNIRDFFQWCLSALSIQPVLAAIGKCSQLEQKQLEKLGIEKFFSKFDSVKLMEDISQALFNVQTYKKSFLEAQTGREIEYHLNTGDRAVPVKAQEIMGDGAFLSFEIPLPPGKILTLNLYCPEELHIVPISVRGSLQGEFSDGQFFQVSHEDLTLWKGLIHQLDQRQGHVTEFLKKASGK